VRTYPSTHLTSAAADGGGLLRCNSDQDRRTGTFFGCVRFDTAIKVQSLQGCSAVPSGVRARRQTISAFEPIILLCSPLSNFG